MCLLPQVSLAASGLCSLILTISISRWWHTPFIAAMEPTSSTENHRGEQVCDTPKKVTHENCPRQKNTKASLVLRSQSELSDTTYRGSTRRMRCFCETSAWLMAPGKALWGLDGIPWISDLMIVSSHVCVSVFWLATCSQFWYTGSIPSSLRRQNRHLRVNDAWMDRASCRGCEQAATAKLCSSTAFPISSSPLTVAAELHEQWWHLLWWPETEVEQLFKRWEWLEEEEKDVGKKWWPMPSPEWLCPEWTHCFI